MILDPPLKGLGSTDHIRLPITALWHSQAQKGVLTHSRR